MIKSKEGIPERPGVYLFKTRKDKILYIGKAKNLKKRLEQYFQRVGDPVIRNLLNQADDIDYIITDDEKDALHLEYNFIHHYRPIYNIRLKDDKSFPSVEITVRDKYPAIYFARHPDSNSVVIGPITNSRKTRDLIDLVTRIFKLRSCSNTVFKQASACLYYYINRCSAPCIDDTQEQDYRLRVKQAIDFLKGHKKAVSALLEKRMRELAENLKFEEAQNTKEDIQLVTDFSLESYISSNVQADYDVIALHLHRNEVYITLFSVIGGRVKRRELFNLDTLLTEREEILKDFCLTFYHQHQNIPSLIVVPFEPADAAPLAAMLSEIAGRKIGIRVPRRGDRKKMLDLALKNLNFYVNKHKYEEVGESVKKQLRLTRFPVTIEGYDISHFSERERIGAVVVFVRGKPLKSRYRNYLIKQAAPGDTEAIREVLLRRFKKLQKHPDLLVIDGGKGQLGTAKEIKIQLGIESDIVAMAKGEERVFLEDGGSVIFPGDSAELFLFQNIRDEAHRRAITHHRQRREKI